MTFRDRAMAGGQGGGGREQGFGAQSTHALVLLQLVDTWEILGEYLENRINRIS